MPNAILNGVLFASIAAMVIGFGATWLGGLFRSEWGVDKPGLRLAGWLLFAIGALAASLLSMQLMVVPIGIVMGALLAISLVNWHSSERNVLYWTLAAAAERGIPLDRAAYAFASDRSPSDRGVLVAGQMRPVMGFLTPVHARARVLGNMLRQGQDLMPSLSAAHLSPDLDVATALIVGSNFGAFDRSLRDSLSSTNEINSSVRRLTARLSYMLIVSVLVVLVGFFISLRIMPMLTRIVWEFGAGAGNAIAGGSPIGIRGVLPPHLDLIILLAFFVLTPFVVVLWILSTFNLLDMDLPIWGHFMRPLDAARIQRALGWALLSNAPSVGAADPLVQVLNLLANQYPKASIRERLTESARQIELGQPWQDALRRQGLLRGSEVAVLNAAQRAGNLSWALGELSARRVLHWRNRLKHVESILFPCAVVGIGLVVFLWAAEIFSFLSQIVEMQS